MTVSDRGMPGPVSAVFRWIRRSLRSFESDRRAEGDSYTATWDLELVAEPDELDGGWIAYCPQLPGCVAQGETEREALDQAASVVVETIKLKAEKAIAGHAHDPGDPRETGPHGVRVAL